MKVQENKQTIERSRVVGLKRYLRSSSYHKRRYNICSGNTYQAGESNHSNY